MKTRIVLAAIGALLASGCIVGENRHILYLDPSGEVEWSILQTELRSDAAEAADRRSEEAGLLDSARAGGHPVALGLDSLGPSSLAWRLLRDRRPYALLTSARFGGLDRLARSVLDELRVPAEVWLEEGEGRRRLVVSIPVGEIDEEPGGGEGPEPAVLALLDDLDRYRIVMTDGAFVEAKGFEILEGGRVAVPREVSSDEIEAAGGRLILTLAWSAGTP